MKINKIFSVAVALTAIFLSACNEDPQGTTPKFPSETQTFTVDTNDTVVVAFSAHSSWQLSSDAMWCKVDGLFLDTSGKAGEQLVTFVITDDGTMPTKPSPVSLAGLMKKFSKKVYMMKTIIVLIGRKC